MLKVVSSRSFEKTVMKLLRFGLHKIQFFRLCEKSPFFNLKKTCMRNGLIVFFLFTSNEIMRSPDYVFYVCVLVCFVFLGQRPKTGIPCPFGPQSRYIL